MSDVEVIACDYLVDLEIMEVFDSKLWITLFEKVDVHLESTLINSDTSWSILKNISSSQWKKNRAHFKKIITNIYVKLHIKCS